MDADVIVVGAGLAGLVAAGELVERRKTVLVVEQRRRVGIHDNHESSCPNRQSPTDDLGK